MLFLSEERDTLQRLDKFCLLKDLMGRRVVLKQIQEEINLLTWA